MPNAPHIVHTLDGLFRNFDTGWRNAQSRWYSCWLHCIPRERECGVVCAAWLTTWYGATPPFQSPTSCQHLPFPSANLLRCCASPPHFPVLASSFGIKFTDNSEAGTAGPESADVVEAGSDASDAALASTASDAANAAAVFDKVRTAHLPLNLCTYNSFYFLRI